MFFPRTKSAIQRQQEKTAAHRNNINNQNHSSIINRRMIGFKNNKNNSDILCFLWCWQQQQNINLTKRMVIQVKLQKMRQKPAKTTKETKKNMQKNSDCRSNLSIPKLKAERKLMYEMFEKSGMFWQKIERVMRSFKHRISVEKNKIEINDRTQEKNESKSSKRLLGAIAHPLLNR